MTASRQAITFSTSGLSYGVAVESVREIRGWAPETPLPNCPAHVRGILNLRGVIVPILDLALMFGRPATKPSPQHVVIIMPRGMTLYGLLVDAVDDIVSFDDEAIQPVPDGDMMGGGGLVNGILSEKDRLIALLDTGRLLVNETACAA